MHQAQPGVNLNMTLPTRSVHPHTTHPVKQVLSNKQLSLMGTVTNLLRCQGEEAFLSFCKRNLALINERQQFHLDDKTTYSLAGKDEREKVLFEYAMGEVYLEQMPAEAQQGIKDTAEMMHRKLRSWFRTGAIAGGAAVGMAMLIGGQLIRSGPVSLTPEQIKIESANHASNLPKQQP